MQGPSRHITKHRSKTSASPVKPATNLKNRYAMSLDRVAGDADLYIGGLFSLRRRDAMRKANITHVVSVLCLPLDVDLFQDYKHLVIEVNDVEDENILQYFPTSNAFIQEGLDGGGSYRTLVGEQQRSLSSTNLPNGLAELSISRPYPPLGTARSYKLFPSSATVTPKLTYA
ncbi:cytidylyltransferase [Physcia stellaris]|nr:cytidylyltransferase [Physcia stellaris]